jgi:uncharacterized protein YdcH (DUF465 family)
VKCNVSRSGYLYARLAIQVNEFDRKINHLPTNMHTLYAMKEKYLKEQALFSSITK